MLKEGVRESVSITLLLFYFIYIKEKGLGSMMAKEIGLSPK